MSCAQLVRMPVHAQDPDAIAIELRESRLRRNGDGDHLPCHGPAILEPRDTDLSRRNIEPARHLTHEILRSLVALLDPKVNEISRARRGIGWDLLDLEVL